MTGSLSKSWKMISWFISVSTTPEETKGSGRVSHYCLVGLDLGPGFTCGRHEAQNRLPGIFPGTQEVPVNSLIPKISASLLFASLEKETAPVFTLVWQGPYNDHNLLADIIR